MNYTIQIEPAEGCQFSCSFYCQFNNQEAALSAFQMISGTGTEAGDRFMVTVSLNELTSDRFKPLDLNPKIITGIDQFHRTAELLSLESRKARRPALYKTFEQIDFEKKLPHWESLLAPPY